MKSENREIRSSTHSLVRKQNRSSSTMSMRFNYIFLLIKSGPRIETIRSILIELIKLRNNNYGIHLIFHTFDEKFSPKAYYKTHFTFHNILLLDTFHIS